jgi:uncharacterized repeat protein (TIGR04076 family)
MSENFAVEKHPVRITVLKKHFHQEFVDKYAANPDIWTECKHFEIGQQFEVTGDAPWAMPEGFCGWAWADIQKLVYGIARGGQAMFVTCCTDGYRPVIFLLEKVMDTPEGG